MKCVFLWLSMRLFDFLTFWLVGNWAKAKKKVATKTDDKDDRKWLKMTDCFVYGRLHGITSFHKRLVLRLVRSCERESSGKLFFARINVFQSNVINVSCQRNATPRKLFSFPKGNNKLLIKKSHWSSFPWRYRLGWRVCIVAVYVVVVLALFRCRLNSSDNIEAIKRWTGEPVNEYQLTFHRIEEVRRKKARKMSHTWREKASSSSSSSSSSFFFSYW